VNLRQRFELVNYYRWPYGLRLFNSVSGMVLFALLTPLFLLDGSWGYAILAGTGEAVCAVGWPEPESNFGYLGSCRHSDGD
jgi:hypothetical protein